MSDVSSNSAPSDSLVSITSQLKSLSVGNALPSSLLNGWIKVLDCISSWESSLENCLTAKHGQKGKALYAKYRGAFEDQYQVIVDPEQAADDIIDLESSSGNLFISWGKPQEKERISSLKIFSPEKRLPISLVTPVLVHFAFVVEDESSFKISHDGKTVYLHIFRVKASNGIMLSNDAIGRKIADCVAGALDGNILHDSLNSLMISAGLDTKELELLRCIRNYARQIAALPARSEANNTLTNHPDASRLLVNLFIAKFAEDKKTRNGFGKLVERFTGYLSSVTSLDEDRSLRVFFNVIESAVRTNYFVPGAKTIAVKLDCAKILRMPEPRPWRETYVYGGNVMEGCHLRGGPVARGGIRWSERPADFRTEVLGLMKTQVTKNAQIVPTGAKGGFIVKRSHSDRAKMADEVRSCYKLLISSLLDMQDNLDAKGKVVPPRHVTVHEPTDPYLVVAADKGTATFSDTANALSAEYSFWLGDAFASGGSNGYDHKVEGITARGAWVSVERHFRDLGKNIDDEPFTVAGVGDMSGDVFGNGMLLSDRIKLIAAFDYRDIIIDPNPDPAKSFAERKRLFGLKRSSWQDYSKKLISKGGGVFPRSLKSIPLSEEARKALGVKETALDPDGLIRAILSAPVDLLYNGGIGTYVKASFEHHSEVGDPQNDGLRISATDLRAKIVGEGGNLGFTQSARIEYALAGGRIYTDAIDNSGGVDLSDHEVNLKILIDGTGKAKGAERGKLLRRFKHAIIDDVLKDNYEQTLAVALDEIRSRRRLTPFANTIADLEKRGILKPELEKIPESDELKDRQREGKGLTRPELAVLISYAKLDTKARLFDSPITQRGHLDDFMPLYFSPEVRKYFGSSLTRHKLKNNILVTVLTNRLVNVHGATIINRLTGELGLAASRIAEGLICASSTVGIDSLRAGICAMDGKLSSSAQYEELIRLEESTVLAARWLIRNIPDLRNKLAETIVQYRDITVKFRSFLPELLPERDRQVLENAVAVRAKAGFSSELAERLGMLEHISSILDAFSLSQRYGIAPKAAAKTLYQVGDRLRLGYLIDQIKSLPVKSDWDFSASADVIADLRRSRKRIASRLIELKMNIDRYCSERHRSTATLQASIARIESEKPDSVSSYIVISNQLQNLASL